MGKPQWVLSHNQQYLSHVLSGTATTLPPLPLPMCMSMQEARQEHSSQEISRFKFFGAEEDRPMN
jgi:hypothetical protein